jgi:hypothetical protein
LLPANIRFILQDVTDRLAAAEFLFEIQGLSRFLLKISDFAIGVMHESN